MRHFAESQESTSRNYSHRTASVLLKGKYCPNWTFDDTELNCTCCKWIRPSLQSKRYSNLSGRVKVHLTLHHFLESTTTRCCRWDEIRASKWRGMTKSARWKGHHCSRVNLMTRSGEPSYNISREERWIEVLVKCVEGNGNSNSNRNPHNIHSILSLHWIKYGPCVQHESC